MYIETEGFENDETILTCPKITTKWTKKQGIKSEAMLKKLKELNSQVPEEKQLTEDQLANLPKVALEEVSITDLQYRCIYR